MQTEGTDEPEQGLPHAGTLPSAADAPRPATGPTTGGIPTGPPVGQPTPPSPDPEPIAVGDPTGGATTTATIAGGPPNPPSGADGSGGALSGDWPVQATDTIVNVVGAVRDRTTGPITTIARGLVFGLLAAVLGTVLAVLLIVAAVRLLDEALPSGVWAAYLVLGVLFVLVGALVFRKRKAGNSNPT